MKVFKVLLTLSISLLLLVLNLHYASADSIVETSFQPKAAPTVHVTIYARPQDPPEERPRHDGPDRSDRSDRQQESNNTYSAPPSALSDIVQFSPGSPGQLIGAPGSFTQKILNNNGILNGSIRQMFGNRSSIGFLVKTPSASGHHYLTINSLGKFNMTVYQVMDLIKKNPDKVFPFLNATGQNGQQIFDGNTYNLNYTVGGVQIINNPVTVSSTSRISFTFSTLPGHTLQGSATHGVFVDSTGEMWLFQEGVGIPNENEALQQTNYAAANVMWGKMSENLKAVIDNTPKAPVRGVPGKTTDGIHYRF